MSKLGRIFKFKYLFFDFGKITGMYPGWLLFMPKKYNALGKKYKKNFKKNVIFACNHNSFQDSFVVMTSFLTRRIHTLMARDVMEKLNYFFYSHIGCIPVDRENVDIEAFQTMCKTLKDKRALMIFPQGRLKKEKDGISFIKSGTILVANKTKTPIVPIFVQPNPKMFHRTKVIIGDPIKAYNENNEFVNADDIEKWTQEVQDAMNRLKQTYMRMLISKKGK